MSAIVGIVNYNQEPVKYEYSRIMMKSLEIFPADSVQILQRKGVFLGCHAQWITPESVGERLPYYDEAKRLAITADAIIDNRDDLCERLQISSGSRKALTDSELILLTYEKWGEDCPKYLVGDFAFLIWNERNMQFFGARDFSGSRTLYYYKGQSEMFFCTTIKPILALPHVKMLVNEEWLAEYLVIPNMVDVMDIHSTVYKDIYQLPPSHSITVKNNKVKLSRYSTLGNEKELKLKSELEYQEAFLDVFGTAVKSRIRTIHKVGTHLSGGLDSGSVTSLASRALKSENKKLHTYSYIPEDDFLDWTPSHRLADERPLIRSTVNYVGNINDSYLAFNGKSPMKEIDDWIEIMEMPYKFFENSFWVKGIFEYAKEQGIGILLSGQRGNFTVSWGPALAYYASLLKKMKLIQLKQEVQSYSNRKNANPTKVMSAVVKKAFPAINQLLKGEANYQFPSVISPDLAKKTDIYSKLQDYDFDISGKKNLNNFEIRKNHFNQLYQWNATGTSGTKLSLCHSLWNRDPTNDLRVVRFCLSVPEEQCVHDGLDRALIRKSMKNYLPDNVRLNQRTRGIQGADWLHRMISNWSEFTDDLTKLINDERILGFLNLPILDSALNKAKQGVLPQDAFDPDYRILMRSLIVYRFIKKIN